MAEFPEWLGRLARDAVAAAYGDRQAAGSYEPDCALINYYDETAKMGMHRDREELVDAPVVSLSIGAACTFRFGNTVNRKAPYTDVELRRATCSCSERRRGSPITGSCGRSKLASTIQRSASRRQDQLHDPGHRPVAGVSPGPAPRHAAPSAGPERPPQSSGATSAIDC